MKFTIFQLLILRKMQLSLLICILHIFTSIQRGVSTGSGSDITKGDFKPLSNKELKTLQKKCGYYRGDTNRPNVNKIFDAKQNLYAYLGEFPWMVQVRGDNKACGGALISNRHVLTAAHCIYTDIEMVDKGNECVSSWKIPHQLEKYPFGKTFSVSYGSPLSYEGKVSKIKAFAVRAFLAEGSNCSTTNDIALLELKKPVPKKMMKNREAGPICLPKYDSEIDKVERGLLIAGWGYDPAKQSSESSLRYTRLTYAKKCVIQEANRAVEEAPKPPDQFCTTETYADPCSGDSGGPLIQKMIRSPRYETIGLVSSGTTCQVLHDNFVMSQDEAGKTREPPKNEAAFFTDIRQHLDWIKQYTNIS